MEKAVIAARKAATINVEEGKNYFWCSCGKSSKQPLCDGSHKGSDFSPIKFTAEKTGKVFLCQCKQTGKSPYCDGAHSKLD